MIKKIQSYDILHNFLPKGSKL